MRGNAALLLSMLVLFVMGMILLCCVLYSFLFS